MLAETQLLLIWKIVNKAKQKSIHNRSVSGLLMCTLSKHDVFTWLDISVLAVLLVHSDSGKKMSITF